MLFGINELLTGYCEESIVTATPNPLAPDSPVAHGVPKHTNTNVPPVAF